MTDTIPVWAFVPGIIIALVSLIVLKVRDFYTG